jgi:hypothetical protein
MKKIIGFLLTILAGFMGYPESSEIMVSFGSVLLTVYFLVNFAKRYIGKDYIQIFSWAIGIILSLAGWYVELGIFAGVTSMTAAAIGFGISLVANGIYDSEFIEAILKTKK